MAISRHKSRRGSEERRAILDDKGAHSGDKANSDSEPDIELQSFTQREKPTI